MRILVLLMVLVLSGCSGGVFHVPKGEYQAQVKTLGVLPLLVDNRSAFTHPRGPEIVELLRRAAAGQAEGIVNELRKKKGYFDVRSINEPPRVIAEKLLLNPISDELGQPGGYQLNLEYLAELCRGATVDGILVLSLQGVVHNDKRWSRKTLETLVTDYNDVMGVAVVVAADGRVLWEMAGPEAENILNLQYPDFDEAYYNKTDAVKLKYIGLTGLERTLLTTAGKDPQIQTSEPIDAWLKKVTTALSPSLFR